jgi:hypothetical protein
LSRLRTNNMNATLVLSNLEATPRQFSAGFTTNAGVTLANDAGERLIEYFGIRAKSNIKLTPTDGPGYYQFATLSDDGTRFWINYQGGGRTLEVDNDGDHRPMVGCSGRAIYLDHSMLMPIEMEYYQGPRFHIALMLLWKKVSGPTPPADQYCNWLPGSTEFFFDTRTGGSIPMWGWYHLLEQGWQVVPPPNFVLPDDTTNPCK